MKFLKKIWEYLIYIKCPNIKKCIYYMDEAYICNKDGGYGCGIRDN